MPLLTSSEQAFARVVSELVHCNPFTSHRIELERQALGREFVEQDAEWNLHPDERHDHPNLQALQRRLEETVERVRLRLEKGGSASEAERVLYEDVVLLSLYRRWRAALDETVTAPGAGASSRPGTLYRQLEQEAARAFVGAAAPSRAAVPHFFACAFQLRRALHHIFDAIIGGSCPAARLRAEVWQSIFTHDMRRYRRVLYGPHERTSRRSSRAPRARARSSSPARSGSRATSPSTRARAPSPSTSRARSSPLNLSALCPTLIESELFGHSAGPSPAPWTTAPVGWRRVPRSAPSSSTRSASSTRRSR